MKKRVLFVTEMYMHGGLERVLTDLLRGLDPDRHELHLIVKAPAALSAELRASLPAHVQTHEPGLFAVQAWQDRVGRSGLPPPLQLPVKALLRLLRDLSFLVNVLVLGRLIARIAPDAVEVVNGGYPGGMVCLAAVVAGRKAGARWVDLYTLSQPFPRKWGAVDGAMDRWVGRSAHRLTSNSSAAGAALAALRGLPREKLFTVYSGLPEDPPAGSSAAGRELARSWRTDPKDVLVGMVSFFVPTKGHRTLLEAAARLAPRCPNVRWVLAGDGPTHAAMVALAAELGVKERVLFLGHHPNNDEVTAALDIVVHPSTQESFPYAVLEAMRAGKPVVASRIAGIPEQIEDGVSGVLIGPGDAEALAGAVERLTRDPEAARTLGEAARRRFRERFTLGGMLKAFAASYEGAPAQAREAVR